MLFNRCHGFINRWQFQHQRGHGGTRSDKQTYKLNMNAQMQFLYA